MGTYYKAGTWNCICDVCGFQFKSDELQKRWDGLIVCKNDFETRHPQELLRVREESNHVTYVNPEPAPEFVAGPSCPYPTQFGLADIGTADCAVATDTYPTLICITTSAIADDAIAGCLFPLT